MTRKIFPNSSLASEAFELVRFRNISTAITDSPKRYNKTNWPPSNMIFGNRNQTTTPGLRANNKIPIQNANGMMMEYTIVADSEADLKDKKIGSSTPIAQGLLGHKLGEIVEIKVPAGLMKFEIVEINF